jgi:transposase-like protein
MEAKSSIRCPRCGADAWYHFGRTATGKRRYICQVCSRQFITDYSYKAYLPNRPACPECGNFMHVYMRDGNNIRFRCSRYPTCRCFIKAGIKLLNEDHLQNNKVSSIRRDHSMQREVVVA